MNLGLLNIFGTNLVIWVGDFARGAYDTSTPVTASLSLLRGRVQDIKKAPNLSYDQTGGLLNYMGLLPIVPKPFLLGDFLRYFSLGSLEFSDIAMFFLLIFSFLTFFFCWVSLVSRVYFLKNLHYHIRMCFYTLKWNWLQKYRMFIDRLTEEERQRVENALYLLQRPFTFLMNSYYAMQARYYALKLNCLHEYVTFIDSLTDEERQRVENALYLLQRLFMLCSAFYIGATSAFKLITRENTSDAILDKVRDTNLFFAWLWDFLSGWLLVVVFVWILLLIWVRFSPHALWWRDFVRRKTKKR